MIIVGLFGADAKPDPTSHTANLKVTIDGVKSSSGTVMMELYERSDGFVAAVKRASIAGLLVDMERVVGVALRSVVGSQSISFSQFPLGRDAAIMCHNENDDRRLGEDAWGVPT